MSTNAMNQTSYAGTLKIVPTKDLAAVGVVGSMPSVLVASTAFAPNLPQVFAAYARANPGAVSSVV